MSATGQVTKRHGFIYCGLGALAAQIWATLFALGIVGTGSEQLQGCGAVATGALLVLSMALADCWVNSCGEIAIRRHQNPFRPAVRYTVAASVIDFSLVAFWLLLEPTWKEKLALIGRLIIEVMLH